MGLGAKVGFAGRREGCLLPMHANVPIRKGVVRHRYFIRNSISCRCHLAATCWAEAIKFSSSINTTDVTTASIVCVPTSILGRNVCSASGVTVAIS